MCHMFPYVMFTTFILLKKYQGAQINVIWQSTTPQEGRDPLKFDYLIIARHYKIYQPLACKSQLLSYGKMRLVWCDCGGGGGGGGTKYPISGEVSWQVSLINWQIPPKLFFLNIQYP